MSENTFSTIVMVYGALQSLLEEFGNTFQQKSLISSAGRKKIYEKSFVKCQMDYQYDHKN